TPFFLSGDDYCGAAWTRLLRTEHRFYEGQTALLGEARLTTTQDFTYDTSTENVIAFDDFGDLADPANDHSATVEYLTSSAAQALHAIDRPQHLSVRSGSVGSGGPLLRDRSAAFDDFANVIQTTVNLGNGSATSDFLRDADGNLQRFVA